MHRNRVIWKEKKDNVERERHRYKAGKRKTEKKEENKWLKMWKM